MSKSQAWKDHRARVLPGRMDYAKKRFRQENIPIISETSTDLTIRCHCNNVRYSPFTGGYTGKGIESGRGLENLIALCR